MKPYTNFSRKPEESKGIPMLKYGKGNNFVDQAVQKLGQADRHGTLLHTLSRIFGF
jgi:hypothetical protein